MLIGWASFALLPFVSFVLCALPALDAHTRLLVRARLEYRVTEKVPVRRSASRSTAQPATPARLRRLEQLPQYRSYAPGSTTAVTDSVLLVYRDLR